MESTLAMLFSTILLVSVAAESLSMVYDRNLCHRILCHQNCHCPDRHPLDLRMMWWTSLWLNLVNHVMKVVARKTFRFHYLFWKKANKHWIKIYWIRRIFFKFFFLVKLAKDTICIQKMCTFLLFTHKNWLVFAF